MGPIQISSYSRTHCHGFSITLLLSLTLMSNVQCGPQVVSDAVSVLARGGKSAEAIIQQLHGRYYETNYRNALFSGSIVGQVTTVGLATTYTGLVLSNPVASTVNLVINKVGISFIVAFPAGAQVGIMTGYNQSTNVTHTTPVTPRSQKFGATTTPTGLLDSAATLPTAPTVNQILMAGLTGAITTAVAIPGLFDLEGSLVLIPGAYAAIYTSTISGAAAGGFSFTWEEVPV